MNDLNEVDATERRHSEDSGINNPSPGTPARLALWGVLALVLVHTAAVALWVAPNNLMRQVVGPTHLASYVQPVFDQAWSVFAPDSDFITDQLEMRPQFRTAAGTFVLGPWTPITSREVVASVRHQPFPSRTVLATTRLAGHIQAAYNDLSTAQRTAFRTAGKDVTIDALRSRLIASGTDAKEDSKAVNFIRVDSAIEYFVSGLARAVWGAKVTAVQYRKNAITVPRFSEHHAQRQVTGQYSLYSNVRPVHALTHADRSAFGAYAREFKLGAP